MIGQMAIAIALSGINNLGHSVRCLENLNTENRIVTNSPEQRIANSTNSANSDEQLRIVNN